MTTQTKNRNYIKVDERNTIIEECLTDIMLPAPWIDITDIPKLKGHEIYKKWYDSANHEIKMKTKIELRVGTTLFLADGEDICCISVRGDKLQPDDEVVITINGEPYSMSMDEDIILISDEPGRFRVAVDDGKYFSDPNSYMIIAEEPEDEDGKDS